jgi:hypothetical protein
MSAPEQTPTPSDIRRTIVRYLLDNAHNPCISIAEGICAVRRTFPSCELTDRQLGDLIAQIAIDAGFAIEFDAADPARPLPRNRAADPPRHARASRGRKAAAYHGIAGHPLLPAKGIGQKP